MKEAFIKAAESINDLSISLNNLTLNSSVSELVESFEFDSCLELIDAIEYYKEREIYNACKALDIILSRHIKTLFGV